MKGIKRTHDFVFELLVLAQGLAVALTLMLLATEVLDSLVVEETICVDASGHLCETHETMGRAKNGNLTYDIPLVHLPSYLGAPPGEDNAG